MKVRGFLSIRRVANVFGALGYGFLVFSYSLSGAALWLWLMQSGVLGWLGLTPDMAALSTSVTTPEPAASPTPLPPIIQVTAYLLTAVMTVAVAFMMAALPYWIGRSASFALKRTIRFLQQPVTLVSLLSAKLLACLVGLGAGSLVAVYSTVDASLLVVQLITLVAASCGFLVQHYIAGMSEFLEAKDIW